MNWQKSLPKRLMPIMIMRKFPYPGTHGNSGVPYYSNSTEPELRVTPINRISMAHNLECPRYEVARYDLEHKIETKLEKQKMHEIMENPERRVEFLSFAEKAFRSLIQT
ncbi:hypothetical protein EVAR_85874_1 [Eumeta japonica]|uniref:Uncharacterized protein n=1 Tax=Eumeta variegata TaxID=151549 RepID=A0A4C2A6M6_EUMVA|nr:hypothetical protein EVAR_85874_1 [Eumeta japonica]